MTQSGAKTIKVVLGALDDRNCAVEPRGDGKWMAQCPAHDDENPSLSITVADDGRVLLNCFAGCKYEAVRDGLGLTDADLAPDKPGYQGQATSKTHGMGTESDATVQPSAEEPLGLTLADYAESKKLPMDFLRTQGLSDSVRDGSKAVRMPYQDEAGFEKAVRYRLSISASGNNGERFRWKSGAKTLLYGLSRLAHAHAEGYVVIVEGESDCHTLWLHDIPAVGLPGANLWREERDARFLEDIPTIYVVIEQNGSGQPDGGGKAVLKWLATSGIRDRVHLVRLDTGKDPSDLYVADPDQFVERFQQALSDAKPWADVEEEMIETAKSQAWEQCAILAQEPHILERFAEFWKRLGVAGEDRVAKLLYLALVSRFLDGPVSVAVKGPSSAGKSFVVEQVLRFFPDTAYHALSAMSERALAYGDEPLEHRFIVLYEAEALRNDLVAYLMRSLLSEGRIRYETVEKTDKGLKGRLVEREGPTGLIVTTTAVNLHPENETRLVSMTVTDSAAQTREVLLTIANERTESPDLRPWLALQRWLERAQHSVTIPYGPTLAEAIPPVAVRLRRDFSAILGLIKAHAILHQVNRQRNGDEQIIATLEDYAVVRELVAPLVAEGVGATISDTVRETVAAVERLGAGPPEGVSAKAVSEELKLDKSSASRRVRVALDRGYLKNLEDRKGRAYRLVLGDPLPGEVEILPPAQVLAKRSCAIAEQVEGYVCGNCGESDGWALPDGGWACRNCFPPSALGPPIPNWHTGGAADPSPALDSGERPEQLKAASHSNGQPAAVGAIEPAQTIAVQNPPGGSPSSLGGGVPFLSADTELCPRCSSLIKWQSRITRTWHCVECDPWKSLDEMGVMVGPSDDEP